MKLLKNSVLSIFVISFLFNQTVFAVPVFQVYIEDAVADTIGLDEDTWFTTGSPFNLIVAGAYGSKTKSLTDVTLALSVPQDETGSISITGGDGVTLLAKKYIAGDGHHNPDSYADIDLLTNEAGNLQGYDGYTDKSFLPDSAHFNSHYPFKADVSDFLLYGIGDFDNISYAVSNYSTDEAISYNIANGQEKTYAVSISGFTSVHFDVYGYEQTGKCKGTWKINPGSHDATYLVPEPATCFLLVLGSVVFLRKRR